MLKGLFFYFLLICNLSLQSFAQTQIRISNNNIITISAKDLPWQIFSGSGEELVNNDDRSAAVVYQASFTIENNTGIDQEYILKTPKTGNAILFFLNESAGTKIQTGSLWPLNMRSEPSSFSCFKFLLRKNEIKNCLLNLFPEYSIYVPRDLTLQLTPQNLFEEQDRKRLFWQGMFLGIILVMALYNLFLLFAVKDISYLYYVVSFVSLGFYFAFYYGIGIEYLWPNAPLWDTFCYTMLVPMTGLARILFTRTYLNTPSLLPGLNRILNFLIIITSITLLAGITGYIMKIDMLSTLVGVIGILGSIILIMMLVAGIAAYNKKYEPAKYFIVANIVLVIGALAFIARELGLADDNFFTRYFVQYGVLIQMVIFSLGLASRLNRTRLELTQETLAKERLALEKEREKKELIKQQSEQLQQQVHEKTIDLQQKNSMLETTIGQVKESENKLSQLNQVKDKLFSIVSHDLRNPLATMQSFLKLIVEHHDKLDEDEKKKLFTEAQQSLDNLNELLYNLLQWSKSQMNLVQFNPERVNLKTVVDNCTRLLKLNAHMKDIQIETHMNGDVFAYADKEMMEFIVRNIVSNAIKFSHRNGQVDVYVEEGKENVQIKVIDNGVGMNAGRIKKLEEMTGTFTRRGTEKEKGTGLGLLISKEFISKNKGMFEIESQLGKGSTFTIQLPKA